MLPQSHSAQSLNKFCSALHQAPSIANSCSHPPRAGISPVQRIPLFGKGFYFIFHSLLFFPVPLQFAGLPTENCTNAQGFMLREVFSPGCQCQVPWLMFSHSEGILPTAPVRGCTPVQMPLQISGTTEIPHFFSEITNRFYREKLAKQLQVS